MSNRTVLFTGDRLRIVAHQPSRKWLVEVRDRNRNCWRVKDRCHHKRALVASLGFLAAGRDLDEFPDLDRWPLRFGGPTPLPGRFPR
ncbi:MAG: hypothetical protein GY807_13750 [Gammaproteobacteria bacterium]|nr:hypothetical protein [Gammaproteobacteria bacterium]